MKMNPAVDLYLETGCGRCSFWNTPQCKALKWRNELELLRNIVLNNSTLTEELKWSMPCYTFHGKNVLMIYAFKEHCAISFFKGTLLKDEQGLLNLPGENSQSARWMKFTSVQEIIENEFVLADFIHEAIEIEKAGLRPELRKPLDFEAPAELQQKMNDDPSFEAAFRALTPGRQRGYALYFSQPKRSETRFDRIEKWAPQILAGKGIHDDYKGKLKAD